jgi:hypothetical protein
MSGNYRLATQLVASLVVFSAIEIVSVKSVQDIYINFNFDGHSNTIKFLSPAPQNNLLLPGLDIKIHVSLREKIINPLTTLSNFLYIHFLDTRILLRVEIPNRKLIFLSFSLPITLL